MVYPLSIRRNSFIISILCISFSSALWSTPTDLKNLSLEDLLNMDVYTANKKEEQLFRTAAAVDVISEEEIHRSGFTTIPESLRLATGLHVARGETGSWGISARGFTSEQGNKMQVVMDGRNVYTPLYSGVFWDVQDTFMPDLDRIEVVRGPGATLWGANAVNGVINILTKEAGDTQGLLVYGGAGNVEEWLAGARYGGEINDSTHFRVYSKTLSLDATLNADGSSVRDNHELNQIGFRIDGHPSSASHWTVQGDLYDGDTTTYRSPNEVKGWNLLARSTYELDYGVLTLQGYYDRVERSVGGSFGEVRDTFDLEIQYQFSVGQRHEIITGVNARTSSDETIQNGSVDFTPPSKTINLWSAFVQDDITLIEDKLSVTLGAKVEQNSYSDIETQPSIRLSFSPNEKHFFWAAVSRAVRTPTRLDHDVLAYFGASVPVVLGNSEIQSEELLAYEIGHRFAIRKNLTAELSLFYNDYENLRVLEPTLLSPSAPYPLVYKNTMNGQSWGAEFVLRMNVTDDWKLNAKYSHLDLDLSFDSNSFATNAQSALESNSPTHMLTIQSLYDFNKHLQFDTTLRAVSNLENPYITGYIELDLRIGWNVSKNWQLELIGHNLLDNQHPEFSGSDTQALEVRRSFFARATFRY